MAKALLTFASLLICLCQLHRVDAEIEYRNISCILNAGSFTNGSAYQENLDVLLNDLSSQASTRSFYNSSTGDGPNKIYGLYQCRGDLSLEVCNECIKDARKTIVQKCPLVVEAAVWYLECLLTYTNRSASSGFETYPAYHTWSLYNVSNYNDFAPVLARTLNSVINDAAQTSLSRGHFATMEGNWTLFDNVYCLAQCTPDLSDFNCRNCLTTARSVMIGLHNTSSAVAVFYPSCQLRYDTTQQFYQVPAPLAPTPSNTTVPEVRLTPPIIAGIAVGASVALILILAGLWFCLCRAKPREAPMTASIATQPLSPPQQKLDNEDLGAVEFVQYDFVTLKDATGDFSTDNKLGEGGFGVVYKGILYNGQEVAIKRLSGNSGQGTKEFTTEARLVAKLQHRNLVKLLGFCSEGDEKLLVYEFLPNTSLDRFLFDPQIRASLDWDTRYKIIMGITRGIHYLHEDSQITIIHRDLKPSNILLDNNMIPKIADFGMARLFEREQKLANTSRIVGTQGYMAPEYLLTGEYSDKTDVYSFGIIILELVSGLKNRTLYQSPPSEDLSIQAWKLWNAGRSFELMDRVLYNSYSEIEVMRCIHIGLLCVQHNAVHRPKMASVIIMLTGSVTLPLPSVPALSPHQFNIPASSDDDGATNRSICDQVCSIAS